MRTDEAKLSKFFINADKVLGENKHAVLAAMKEAMEEYAKAFAVFTQAQGLMWADTRNVWVDEYYVDRSEDYVIDMFNTHQAAIEAEKERGKG